LNTQLPNAIVKNSPEIFFKTLMIRDFSGGLRFFLVSHRWKKLLDHLTTNSPAINIPIADKICIPWFNGILLFFM